MCGRGGFLLRRSLVPPAANPLLAGLELLPPRAFAPASHGPLGSGATGELYERLKCEPETICDLEQRRMAIPHRPVRRVN